MTSGNDQGEGIYRWIEGIDREALWGEEDVAKFLRTGIQLVGIQEQSRESLASVYPVCDFAHTERRKIDRLAALQVCR